MDALSVLRDYTVRGELDSVRRVGDDFCFGDDYRFPYNTVTAYRFKTGRYTLDALIFFLNNRHLKHTDYFQQARNQKVQTVSLTDRKALLDYLDGKSATNDLIDLDSSLATASAPSVAPSEEPLLKRHKREHFNENIQIVRSLERPVRDRDTILLCANKSFESILSILNNRREVTDDGNKRKIPPPSSSNKEAATSTEKPQRPPSFIDSAAAVTAARRPPPPPPPPAALLKSAPPAGRKIEGMPIILVPAASQTLLNTYNAKEFLEDGVYATVETKAKSTAKKPESLIITRKIGRDPAVKYEVRDKAASLAPKDWERVVAVFVLGKEWQFKDWPFKDHVEIFNKILGVYLRFEDDSMESVKVVMQWNVKIISLSKHKRHQDRTAVLEFWDKLDAFVRARRLAITF